MRDIETRADIERVLQSFYSRAFQDSLIGHFFTEIIPLNMNTHLPQIANFWEAVLFNSHGYGKDVMKIHQHIHQLSAISKEQLDRWVQLFTETIDAAYEGNKATLMKQRAASIATLMHLKLHHPQIRKL